LLTACSLFHRPSAIYEHARTEYLHGDVAGAAAETARAADTWRDPNSPWYWKFRLLHAEALTTLARYAEAEQQLNLPAPTRRELRQETAWLLTARANLNVTRQMDASSLIREARQLATDRELQIKLNLIEGIQAANQRQNARAQALYDAALALAVQQGNSYYQALALNNSSIISRRLRNLERAIADAQHALTLAERAQARRVAALAQGSLGTSYATLGDFDAAMTHEQKAVQLCREMTLRVCVMNGLGELALIYDRAHEVTKAVPIYKQAYEMAKELQSRKDAVRFAGNLALALVKLQQWDDAAEWNERAAVLAADLNANENLPYVARNRGRIAYGLARFDEARRLSEETLRDKTLPPDVRWSVLDTLAEAEVAQHDYAAANRHFADAVSIIDGNRSNLARSQFKITLVSYLIPFYREYVEALEQQKNDMAALRVVESSRARVLEERLGRELRAETLSTPAVLSKYAKDANVSLLSFWCAGGRSFAWLITSQGIKRFDLPPLNEIETLVTSYRNVVEHSIQDPMSVPPDLWNKVLAPIVAKISKGSRVIVIPDGPLHRLNLETLVVPTPQPHYWIEDVEIAVAPSIVIAMSKPTAARPESSALLIGDPEYKGTDYEPLPGAASELNEIAACLRPAVIRNGPKATPRAYREADPSKFQVIHFAAHADANAESPLDSAVVLSHQGDSYKLYARDVIDIPIHADLVTLSACRSAGAREYAGEGLIGFAWAFLQAGARSVVAGLWNVADSSSGPLMSCFYKGIAAHQDVVSAMHAAKLEMLHSDRFRKPFYWGPFQVYLASAQR
jgi:CHAT domain-containing protein